MEASVQTKTRPKHERIAAELRRRIDSGELQLGARIAGEYQLAEQHGVSRLTARRALDELAREGLLERTPGRGTFVASRTAIEGRLDTEKCVGLAMRASGDFFSREARFLVGRLQQRGLLTLLLDLSPSEDLSPEEGDAAVEPVLKRALSLRLAAMVIEGGYLHPAIDLEPALGRHRPVIVMNRLTQDPDTLDRPTMHSVTTDYRAAGRMAARHLLDQGHRRLLFCGYGEIDPRRPWLLTPVAEWNEHEYLAGCREALAEYDLNPAHAMQLCMNVGTKGRRQPDIGRILRGLNLPTGILTLGDWRAQHIYDAAAAEGLQVGRDLAVVGFGDTPWATTFRPQLTSLDLRPEKIAETLDTLIVRLIDAPKTPSRHLRIRPRLVIRESSANS
ncbi:MAG: substrate-binding domain-containing protein [Candidatus Pacebacteria bacterium]|nr:substrate-binding domain-containing protein [Candidatus Paceibacterota bacterium]